jgi:hypothetical protein
MTLSEYMAQCYFGDLEKFHQEVGATIPYLAGDELTRHCERLGIRPVHFISLTYLESLLLAAVCTYDFPNFENYRDAIQYQQHLGTIGGLQGLRLPQKMFAALHWSPDQMRILREGIPALLSRWAAQYDRQFRSPGTGKRIVENLLYDADVDEIPQRVEPAFMQAVRAGVVDAATSLAIQRDPARPIQRHIPGYQRG